MDFTTVAGLIIGFGLVGFSIATGPGGLAVFMHTGSMMIVGGGTIAVTLMNFPMGDLKGLIKVMMRTLFFKIPSATQEIERVVDYANLARKEGLLALENKLTEVDDKFFHKGVQLVIDGFPAETVRDIMELEAEWQRMRHANGKKMLDAMGSFAPAFGMIGTLVGLVQMLQNLVDPSKIGGGMATALLTTLYGAMAANMVFIPLAGKLEQRAKEESLLRDLMIEGIVAIQSGDGPQLIKEKLKSFLSPSVAKRSPANRDGQEEEKESRGRWSRGRPGMGRHVHGHDLAPGDVLRPPDDVLVASDDRELMKVDAWMQKSDRAPPGEGGLARKRDPGRGSNRGHRHASVRTHSRTHGRAEELLESLDEMGQKLTDEHIPSSTSTSAWMGW